MSIMEGHQNPAAHPQAEDEQQQECPRCQQTDFDYQDLDEGTKLVCTECGYVLDEILLVHHRTYNEDGGRQAGVWVVEGDDGRMAGASMLPAGANSLGMFRGSGSSRQLILASNTGRLDGGLSYLELPQHICNAARQLLTQVVDAYGQQPEGVMQIVPATVAAVIYISARQQGRALSLGTAASALEVQVSDVFRELRRVVKVCDLEVAPPSLDAIVIHAAVRLLPHYLPDTSTPLRQQPLVQKALQLTSLMIAVGAADGHSPWVAAAAVWSIVLAEHYKDATAKAYAKQVAAHLQHTTQHVVQHITKYDKQLAALLDLLPFARSEDADVAVQVARHAGTLIKLQQLSRATQ